MDVGLMSAIHTPVLVSEVLSLLAVRPGGRYIDCTVGGGGHARAILEAALPGGRLLGIDLDPQAIAAARQHLASLGEAALLVEGNFRDLAAICQEQGFKPVDGILFDLGLSSQQLAQAERGFSFQREAPLDMRVSPRQTVTAADIVNTYRGEEIADILWRYGEERYSRRIARHIVVGRPFATTTQLARAIEQAVGRARGRIHPATRTFQALRIVVNQELENLSITLQQAHSLLGFGGRLVIISYHSLEDRLVKAFLQREARDCVCPPQTPLCQCGHQATLRLLTRRAARPSPLEVAANPRSRSARLRCAEKTG